MPIKGSLQLLVGFPLIFFQDTNLILYLFQNLQATVNIISLNIFLSELSPTLQLVLSFKDCFCLQKLNI